MGLVAFWRLVVQSTQLEAQHRAHGCRLGSHHGGVLQILDRQREAAAPASLLPDPFAVLVQARARGRRAARCDGVGQVAARSRLPACTDRV